MAAAVLEINESKLELVCDECDFYGSNDTIFIDNSTQTDNYDDDEESELKPLKPRLSQIIEEDLETEGAVKEDEEMQVETNGIRIDNDNNNDSDGKATINGAESKEADDEEDDVFEEAPIEEEVPAESDDEEEIDDVARLTGLAFGMGYARIIDYDNLRIIEHVIESDDEDENDGAAAGTAATSAELQQACQDLVTFIGESYQVIERSGHTREPPAILSVVDNNNNNRSSEISTNGRGPINERSKAGRKVQNGQQANQKASTSASATSNNSSNSNPSNITAATSTSSALIKAYKSNLTPLAPPFQPAALKAKQQQQSSLPSGNMSSVTTTTTTALGYTAYEQTTVYYQQQHQRVVPQQHL